MTHVCEHAYIHAYVRTHTHTHAPTSTCTHTSLLASCSQSVTQSSMRSLGWSTRTWTDLCHTTGWHPHTTRTSLFLPFFILSLHFPSPHFYLPVSFQFSPLLSLLPPKLSYLEWFVQSTSLFAILQLSDREPVLQ